MSTKIEMSKNILYTKYAEDVVKVRKISKKLIDKALTDPDETINQNETKINHKIVGSKILRVIYKKSGNSYRGCIY